MSLTPSPGPTSPIEKRPAPRVATWISGREKLVRLEWAKPVAVNRLASTLVERHGRPLPAGVERVALRLP